MIAQGVKLTIVARPNFSPLAEGKLWSSEPDYLITGSCEQSATGYALVDVALIICQSSLLYVSVVYRRKSGFSCTRYDLSDFLCGPQGNSG